MAQPNAIVGRQCMILQNHTTSNANIITTANLFNIPAQQLQMFWFKSRPDLNACLQDSSYTKHTLCPSLALNVGCRKVPLGASRTVSTVPGREFISLSKSDGGMNTIDLLSLKMRTCNSYNWHTHQTIYWRLCTVNRH